MSLMNKSLEMIPGLYATENVKEEEKMVLIKYFIPDSNWSWYVTEYDKEKRLFFGYVVGLEKEWGYFSLDELEATTGPLGLHIEEDKNFKPRKFKDIEELQ